MASLMNVPVAVSSVGCSAKPNLRTRTCREGRMRQRRWQCRQEEDRTPRYSKADRLREQVGSSAMAALAALSVSINVWTGDGMMMSGVGLGKPAQAHAEEFSSTSETATPMTIQEKREQMRLKRLAQVEEEKKRVEEQRIMAEEAKRQEEIEKKRVMEEEQKKREEEEKKREEEQKKREEEQKKREEEQKKRDEEQRIMAEEREEKKREEEQQKETEVVSQESQPLPAPAPAPTVAAEVEQGAVIIQQPKAAETKGLELSMPEAIDLGAAQQQIQEKSAQTMDSLKSAIPKFSFGSSSEPDGGIKAKKPIADSDTPPVPKSELVLSIRKNLTDFVNFFTFLGRSLVFLLRIAAGVFYYFATALTIVAKVLSSIFG